ncbi:MAG: putative metal-binding motif-containing protein [Deltaproteobacteria bacterium]|nr:putative metal-binding motif-containing protein [Deltaproteobacteria bacterium]
MDQDDASGPADDGAADADGDGDDAAGADAEVAEDVQLSDDSGGDSCVPVLVYTDADGDGFGDATTAPTTGCPGPGLVTNEDDCDDDDGHVHPGAVERCDGVDENCSGAADEGCDDDGDNWCDVALETVGAPGVCPNGGGDCADDDPARHPGITESCNELDDDCDGATDEDRPDHCLDYRHDGDGDTYGDPFDLRCLCDPGDVLGYTIPSMLTSPGDCDDDDATVHPGAFEICDGLDNDCDGYLDPSEDADRDGYGGPGCGGLDCDDADPRRNPGMAEGAAVASVIENPAASDHPSNVIERPDGRIQFECGSLGSFGRLFTRSAAGAWSITTVNSPTGTVAGATLMPDGALGMLYPDSSGRVRWGDDSTWYQLPECPVDVGLYFDLLRPMDRGNVVVPCSGLGGSIGVLRLQLPDGWITDEADGAGGGRPFGVARGLDGRLFLLAVAGGEVRLYQETTAGWRREVVATLDGGVSSGSLSVDPHGRPVVAVDPWYDPLRVYRREDTGWTLLYAEPASIMEPDDGSGDAPSATPGPHGRFVFARWSTLWESIHVRVVEATDVGVLATWWSVDALRSDPSLDPKAYFLAGGRLAVHYIAAVSPTHRFALLSRAVGDGVDSDCDGEDLLDGDGDGEPPFVAGGLDCDDGDAGIRPGLTDATANGVDEDCDGLDGPDTDGDWHAPDSAGGDDCDDDDARRFPTAADTAPLVLDHQDLDAPTTANWAKVRRVGEEVHAVGRATGGDDIVVAVRAADGTWTSESLTPPSSPANFSYDATVPGGGGRYLTFCTPAMSCGDLNAGVFDGGTWTIETVDTVGEVGLLSQIADVAGGLQVFYADTTNHDLRRARRSSSGTWTTERMGTDEPHRIVLRRAPDGTPWLFVSAGSGTSQTHTLYRFASGSWEGFVLTPSRRWPDLAGSVDIAFHMGQVWVGYYVSSGYLGNLDRQLFTGSGFTSSYVSADDFPDFSAMYYFTIDAQDRFWYVCSPGLIEFLGTGYAVALNQAMGGNEPLAALPDGSLVTDRIGTSQHVFHSRYARVGDGIDEDCDGIDGVDADGDGHASWASGGDDCDDDATATHANAADSPGDDVDSDCDTTDD